MRAAIVLLPGSLCACTHRYMCTLYINRVIIFINYSIQLNGVQINQLTARLIRNEVEVEIEIDARAHFVEHSSHE